MDFTINWSQRSIADLEAAVEYLELVAPASISKFECEVVSKMELVKTNPYYGAKYELVNSGLVREVYCHPYRFIYRLSPSKRTIELITIWHGSRDEPSLF